MLKLYNTKVFIKQLKNNKMENLLLLSNILSCIKDCKAYQNHLRETLLEVQQKLRWISLTHKKSAQKKEKVKQKCKRKRLPYHSIYQLLNILKTKVKRPQFPSSDSFDKQTLSKLFDLYNQHPNNWEKISSILNKPVLLCVKNYQQKVSEKFSSLKKLTWTEAEDLSLFEAVDKIGKKNWTEVSNWVDGKTSSQCYHRYMKTLNPSIKRGKWTFSEDIKLLLSVKVFGNNWVNVSEQIKHRTDIQCRERYCNILCPDINNNEWTKFEDLKLCLLILAWGKKWSKIARLMRGRTDNQCWRRSKFLIKASNLMKGFVIIRIFRPTLPEAVKKIFVRIHGLFISL